MYQPMPTGLYTRWEYKSENQRLTPRPNESRSFERMILSHFQRLRPDCKIESNVTAVRQKQIDCFSVHGVCNHRNAVSEAMGCYYYYCPCQRARTSPRDADIERRVKKREQDEIRDTTKTFANRWDVGVWVVESL